MAELDKIRTELLNRSAITLQRHARGFVKRSQYQRKRRAIVTLQASACPLEITSNSDDYDRSRVLRRSRSHCPGVKKSACAVSMRNWKTAQGLFSVQAHGRGFLARKEARRLRQLAAATHIQAAVRAHIARSAFLRKRAAVLRIQAAYRGHTARAVATDLRQHRAALHIQAAWRGRVARRKFLATRRGVVALQVLHLYLCSAHVAHASSVCSS